MESVAQVIKKTISEIFNIDTDVQLDRPDSKFGDFATNVAMQLAGRLGKNPREIAETLVVKLNESGEFTEVSMAGPGFINLRLGAKKLSDVLNSQWSSTYGGNNDGAGKKVIVEFPSQNMAKPYSIGHLRPGNQGWAVKRLMEATGWEVVTDNHLGDYGAPFGIWVVGFLRFSSEEQLSKNGVYELGRIYIETKKALKDEATDGNHELADAVQDWLIKLENGDEEAINYSKRFNEISIAHIHEVMNRLKISTDYEYGEAFYAQKGKQAVEDLVNRGIAIKNEDGSIIVKLDEFGIDVPLLLLKSNGAALYATTDLATIEFRESEFKPDRVIYCVGAEQQFYFRQLFSLAKKIGVQTELIHLWFGLIEQMTEEGVREKMSSRKGVVLMEELLDIAETKAREIVADRGVSEDDIKKIAVGAIKFTDFVSDRRTNILFNWDSIFALSGVSGPYVQYAAVRVNKILRDNEFVQETEEDYDYEPEKQVLLKLLEYPEVIRAAANDLEPHKIAAYLYELARELNRYYETTPIATDSVGLVERTARLMLIQKVSHIFSHGLSLLGIEVPSAM